MTVERFRTPGQAATYLGLSKSYLEKLRVSGGGPAWFRLGTRRGIRYDTEELDRWVLSRRHQSTTEYASRAA